MKPIFNSRFLCAVALVLGTSSLVTANAQLLKKPRASTASAAPAHASETLGLATFIGPAGWTRKSQANFVTFESVNASNGTWSIIAVYGNRAGSGDATNDFNSEWAQVVGARFQGAVPTELETRQNPVGYTLKLGGNNVSSEAGAATAILVVASGFGNVTSALFLTNTADTVAVFDRFIQGVSLKKPDAATPAASTSATPTNAGGAGTVVSAGPRPKELIGTWVRGGVSGPAMYNSVTGSFQGLASGSGGFMELKANGEAQMTSLSTNSGGCGSSIYSDAKGTWSATASVLTITLTEGEAQLGMCGKVTKSKGVKLGVQTIPYRLYSFQGQPSISLHPDTDSAQSYSKK
jgi:hypothetical protein